MNIEMKKIIVIAVGIFLTAAMASAQGFKIGRINMQEIVYLMDETDSARVEMEKFDKDMRDTYNAMLEELNTKYTTYEQMRGSWSPAVLATKEQELQDLQARLQQYQQSAQVDAGNLQNRLMTPIMQKANEAVTKVGKANGLIFILDLSTGAFPYYDEVQTMDVTALVKAELNISPDKTLPQANMMQ